MNSRSAAPKTELNLIAQAQQGDRNAFCELVRLHRVGVINVVYRLCGDAELAEDAAQDAFIKAWQNIQYYQPRSPFKNWVYRIATNTALDQLRRKRNTIDIDNISMKSSNPTPEAVAISLEQADLIQKAILALPPASRTVIILREYENFSYREIAESLNIPLGTVMSRLNYARKQLRKSLASILEIA